MNEREIAGKGERIAKRMARAGLCSRREAEAWILAGRVRVDGALLQTPACVVQAQSRIEVDGVLLQDSAPALLFRYHKPAGLLTTAKDPEGRPTLFAQLPKNLPRLVSVGRLDLNSEGLLLLTNDGGLARYLELPATKLERHYRARVFGTVDARALQKLADGVTVDGVHYEPIEAKLDRQQGRNAWLSIMLREGKNREIRKVMAHLGLSVSRLIRVQYGPFPLGKLLPSEIEEVPARTLRSLLPDFFAAS